MLSTIKENIREEKLYQLFISNLFKRNFLLEYWVCAKGGEILNKASVKSKIVGVILRADTMEVYFPAFVVEDNQSSEWIEHNFIDVYAQVKRMAINYDVWDRKFKQMHFYQNDYDKEKLFYHSKYAEYIKNTLY